MSKKNINKSKLNNSSSKLEYTIENLHCINCAGKIEEKISNLKEVTSAKLNFSTARLTLAVNNSKNITSTINKIADSIEPGVKFVEIKNKNDTKIVLDNSKIPFDIIVGAILFTIGQIAHHLDWTNGLGIVLLGYIILGQKIVFTALKNIVRGRVFDENLLMTIATLGAFGIGEYPEGVGVMLFYRIGEYFEERATNSSRREIMSIRNLKPTLVHKVCDDDIKDLSTDEINIGDLILVRVGDRIPLDGILVEGVAKIDNSAITGESEPISANVGGEILSGGINLFETIKIRVTKTDSDSMINKIIESVENASNNKPRMDKFIHRFAKIYTPIVVSIALIVAIVPSIFTGNWYYWIYTALTFLVISCPCALVLSVPLAFFSGIGLGSKEGILFKGGMAIESLAKVKAVVMDKTGTLTKGKFQVNSIDISSKISREDLISLTASAEKNSSHPIANSIVELAKKENIPLIPILSSREIAGKGIIAKIKNGNIICGNKTLLYENNIIIPKEYEYKDAIHLGFNDDYLGCIFIGDEIKEDAIISLDKLKKMGLHLVMLTGDSDKTARKIAQKLSIKDVFSQLLPQDKLNKLHEIRKKIGAVFFIGDGINDAPILAGSDVGAAMGSGADIAIESSDVVFLNNNVSSIVRSIKIAKTTIKIAWQNVILAIGVKILIMILGLCGYSSMWTAVFADTGVAILCIFNSMKILYKNKNSL